jgi:adenylosuccinate synthase
MEHLHFDQRKDLLTDIRFDGEIERIGVMRPYMTRHGPGPFPTECGWANLRDGDNVEGPWQGKLRTGWFDMTLAHYALRVNPVDALAFTNVDRFGKNPEKMVSLAYEELWIDGSKSSLSLPVRTTPYGLAHQEMLTEMLRKVHPIYRSVTESPEEFMGEISKVLKVPVAVYSTGRTATDKQKLEVRA